MKRIKKAKKPTTCDAINGLANITSSTNWKFDANAPDYQKIVDNIIKNYQKSDGNKEKEIGKLICILKNTKTEKTLDYAESCINKMFFPENIREKILSAIKDNPLRTGKPDEELIQNYKNKVEVMH